MFPEFCVPLLLEAHRFSWECILKLGSISWMQNAQPSTHDRLILTIRERSRVWAMQGTQSGHRTGQWTLQVRFYHTLRFFTKHVCMWCGLYYQGHLRRIGLLFSSLKHLMLVEDSIFLEINTKKKNFQRASCREISIFSLGHECYEHAVRKGSARIDADVGAGVGQVQVQGQL